jgi:hypothetical protein
MVYRQTRKKQSGGKPSKIASRLRSRVKATREYENTARIAVQLNKGKEPLVVQVCRPKCIDGKFHDFTNTGFDVNYLTLETANKNQLGEVLHADYCTKCLCMRFMKYGKNERLSNQSYHSRRTTRKKNYGNATYSERMDELDEERRLKEEYLKALGKKKEQSKYLKAVNDYKGFNK